MSKIYHPIKAHKLKRIVYAPPIMLTAIRYPLGHCVILIRTGITALKTMLSGCRTQHLQNLSQRFALMNVRQIFGRLHRTITRKIYIHFISQLNFKIFCKLLLATPRFLASTATANQKSALRPFSGRNLNQLVCTRTLRGFGNIASGSVTSG